MAPFGNLKMQVAKLLLMRLDGDSIPCTWPESRRAAVKQ
jgi:hypothetical protein